MRPDTSKLPATAKIEEHVWKADPGGGMFELPPRPRSIQYVVQLEQWHRGVIEYLQSLGFKTWGSGGLRWLGDLIPTEGT
jgi:hypothetical protein